MIVRQRLRLRLKVRFDGWTWPLFWRVGAEELRFQGAGLFYFFLESRRSNTVVSGSFSAETDIFPSVSPIIYHSSPSHNSQNDILKASIYTQFDSPTPHSRSGTPHPHATLNPKQKQPSLTMAKSDAILLLLLCVLPSVLGFKPPALRLRQAPRFPSASRLYSEEVRRSSQEKLER